MACSRLGQDRFGRPVAVVTTPEVGLPIGTVYIVLGNAILTTIRGDERLFGWTGEPGRPPTARERAGGRPPYEISKTRKTREVIDDADLDDAAAIEYARREQQREPADLLSAAA